MAHRIIVVDDHPLFRGALTQALSSALAGAQIDEAASLAELENLIAQRSDTDLVLLDLSMPGVQGLSGLLLLRSQHPDIPVVVVSAHDDPETIRRCMEFGASGYVPKSLSVEEIRTAVEKVLGGGIWIPPDTNLERAADIGTADVVARLSTLTPQQVRVLMMLGQGLLNKQIAFQLSVSEATIKAHVSAILQKLNVDSRTQAVIAINRIEGDWRSLKA
ncbi:MAG: response regulator transcription factor [Hyphomicrobiaceae bacterium]